MDGLQKKKKKSVWCHLTVFGMHVVVFATPVTLFDAHMTVFGTPVAVFGTLLTVFGTPVTVLIPL